MQKKWLVGALSALFCQIPSFAQSQTTASDRSSNLLEEIVISATRTRQQSGNIPSVVTRIRQERIQEKGMRDIGDLFHDELDVSVRSGPTRFTAAGPGSGRSGNESINIRGLEGNQVLMMLDGVRLPNSFSFASFSTGRGDFLELNGLRSVEVLRGPASTQYGSDGLAGAVLFHTLRPEDLVRKGENTGAYLQGSVHSVDGSYAGSAGVAHLGENWDVMLLTSYRKGHETSNQGQNYANNSQRTAPNPVDYNLGYLLGKIQYHLSPTQLFTLTVESQRRGQETEVLSANAIPPFNGFRQTTQLRTDDSIKRDRVSLYHLFEDDTATWLQKAESHLYWQSASIQQQSFEDRALSGFRSRDNLYDSDSYGGSTVLESRISQETIPQRITYGLDFHVNSTKGKRDGTSPPAGETFPVRPFPDTRYTLIGGFVQDEITLSNFIITPAVRFDSYRLSPTVHAEDAFSATRLTDHAFSPRIGIVWNAQPAFRPFFQWSYGFRAPTPDQVNNGFKNDANGYQTIGNPNLKAEQARSLEIGMRGKIESVQYSLSAYDNHYDHFISQETIRGTGIPFVDPLIFQYVNLTDAHIWGIDLRTQWEITPEWKATVGLVYAKGTSTKNGATVPLDTVNPLKAALGLRYDTATWGTHAQMLFQQAKNEKDTVPIRTQISSLQAPYTPSSWYTLDLGAYWKPDKRWSIHANINNVFDRTYWAWSDVRGLQADSPIIDAYSAAGRNFQFSIRYQF